MVAISRESLRGKAGGKKAGLPPMTISAGDECEIVMTKSTGDRLEGQSYIVDSSLARHYCEGQEGVAKPVANLVKGTLHPKPSEGGSGGKGKGRKQRKSRAG